MSEALDRAELVNLARRELERMRRAEALISEAKEIVAFSGIEMAPFNRPREAKECVEKYIKRLEATVEESA